MNSIAGSYLIVVIKEDMRLHLISPLIASETSEQVNLLGMLVAGQGLTTGAMGDRVAGLEVPRTSRFLIIDFQVSCKPLPTFLASATEPSFLDAVPSL
jgi:hypothetical protein